MSTVVPLSPRAERGARPGPGAAWRTLLTFRLQGELFALDVERVQEILDPLPSVRVPRAGPFVPGLVNVRGAVVPVVALRHRLGMPPAERTADSRMVVLDIAVEDETTRIAIEADAVEKVLEIEEARIEPVPDIGIGGWPPGHLAGVAQVDGDLIILLRAETVFEPERGGQNTAQESRP